MTNRLPTNGRRYITLGLAIGLLSVLCLVLFWPVERVSIRSDSLNCFMPHSSFALEWQHSVEKERWRESYRIHDNALLLTHSQFKTYGAGTPHTGSLIENANGQIDYQVNRQLSELNWVVSTNVQSTLWLGQQAWPLFEWLADYEVLQFQVRRIYFWQLLTLDSCDDYFRQTNRHRHH